MLDHYHKLPDSHGAPRIGAATTGLLREAGGRIAFGVLVVALVVVGSMIIMANM